jgi:hypothetical protein
LSTSERPLASTALDPHDIEALLVFSESVISGLRLDDGIFCFDRTWDSPALRGRSLRYSMMVLLGLQRRRASGGRTSIDVDELHRLIRAERDTLGVGDLGLLLWTDVRAGGEFAAETLRLLDTRSAAPDALAGLEGMEAAWFVLGAVEAAAAGHDANRVLDRAYRHMLARKSPSSPLFRHTATGRGRALLPNFASEIYTLLALTEVARHDLAPGALDHAVRLASKLIDLRLADAGWPWLFHADRAVVAEPYEVYSVHQDAMAPMALFALSEVTSDDSFARAAVEGFGWCFGRNELGFNFYDVPNRFAHRSIKRKGHAHKANLWTNSALGLLGMKARANVGGVMINATCRPYHLGWILEAWSGREHLRQLVD